LIEINNVKIYGMDESFIASSYPMRTDLPKNWGLKDSYEGMTPEEVENHYKRSVRLGTTPIGEGHDNFLNGIIVQFDFTAPIKVWTEAQRYHFLDFVSSQSTMHRLVMMDMSKDSTWDEHVDGYIKRRMELIQEDYDNWVDHYNKTVEKYGADSQEAKDAEKGKQYRWLKLLMSCPVGLLLTARMTTNYRQLKTIYSQRKNHRLPHWREFCSWIERLPNSKLIIGKE
jgi:hypothetical protein